MSEWYRERVELYDRIAVLREELAHAQACNAVLRWHNKALAEGVAELMPEDAET